MEDIGSKFNKAEEYSLEINKLINSGQYSQAYQLYLAYKNEFNLSFYVIPPNQGNKANN